MFGNSSGPSRVFKYGLLPPVIGADIVDEQMRLAHRYYNTLVEIERKRRGNYRDLFTPFDEVRLLQDRERELLEKQNSARGDFKRSRSGVATIASLLTDKEMNEISKELKSIGARVKKERKKICEEHPDVQSQVDENDLARANEARVARSKSGLYWGTYLHTEQSFEKAKHSHIDPGFKHFNGDGHLAVQIQKGIAVADVFGEDTRIRIEPVPEEGWSSPIRSERRRLSKTRLWFRVGSEGRKPVWAVFPMTMHRPLPSESRIKWVHLIRERIGTQYRYSVNFAVEYPSEPVIETGEGTVAIDIGWRLMEDGLRVAYWYDSQGKEGELKLPLRILTALQKCDDIRSIRDDNFNKAKAELCGLLPWMEPPEWFQKDTATLHLWRSTGRLASLVLKWRDNRFDGDAEVYEMMEAWRKRDKHLLDYEANLRDKTLTHRREIYRVFASELRKKYDTAILEAFDLRDIAEQPEPEKGPKEHTGSRTRRPIAALSQLRQSIKDSGLRIVEVSPKNTSRRCHVCGHIEVGFTEVQHQCSNCGRVWDRDRNAAMNILRSGSKHLEPEQT